MADMGAVVIGGVAAVIAVWGVITQRAIARRRTTIDFIAHSESDKDLIDARREFIRLSKNGGLAQYAAEDKEHTVEAQNIRIVLNEFELIAIGIQRGIIDYTLYYRWNRSATIRYWNHASPFVHELRERLHNKAIYQEFEVLVGWLHKEHMPRRLYWAGQLF